MPGGGAVRWRERFGRAPPGGSGGGGHSSAAAPTVTDFVRARNLAAQLLPSALPSHPPHPPAQASEGGTGTASGYLPNRP
jgi:hypothetical protein